MIGPEKIKDLYNQLQNLYQGYSYCWSASSPAHNF